MTTALIGASKQSQIEDSVLAVRNTTFADEEFAKIDELAGPGGNVNRWSQSSEDVSHVCGRPLLEGRFIFPKWLAQLVRQLEEGPLFPGQLAVNVNHICPVLVSEPLLELSERSFEPV